MPTRGNFARRTDVPEETTRANIEHVLKQYGAVGYGITWEGNRWQIKFKISNRFVQVDFVVPDGSKQASRSFWRAIYNVIKFKLEAVAIGYSTIEREFLPDVLLPDGSKLGTWIHPQLEQAYKLKKMPPMLPWGNQG